MRLFISVISDDIARLLSTPARFLGMGLNPKYNKQNKNSPIVNTPICNLDIKSHLIY